MYYKKILTIVIIILLAFVIVGSVQAESNGTKTTIHGIDFNIPDGFKESDLSQKNLDSGDGTTADMLVYTGNNGANFTIIVNEFEDVVAVTDIVVNDSADVEKVTIKNIDGYLGKMADGTYTFQYVKGKCSVAINAPDKEFIEDIII